MLVRLALEKDIEAIMEMYAYARKIMRESGNPGQWGDAYPYRSIIEEDIRLGQSYVCEEGGVPVGVFAFILGEEPDYRIIENGQWSLAEPYGTIHRIASNGRAKGVAAVCFDFCRQQIPYLRIDTHHDNKIMQKVLADFGFLHCGTIYVREHSARLAYEYIRGAQAVEKNSALIASLNNQ